MITLEELDEILKEGKSLDKEKFINEELDNIINESIEKIIIYFIKIGYFCYYSNIFRIIYKFYSSNKHFTN
jgi:hypothetical protein